MNCLVSDREDVLSSSEETLIYFASFLARTVCQSTIKIYLTTVRNLDISCGHDDRLGILRYVGQRRILRQPVTPWMLLAIRPILEVWSAAGSACCYCQGFRYHVRSIGYAAVFHHHAPF